MVGQRPRRFALYAIMFGGVDAGFFYSRFVGDLVGGYGFTTWLGRILRKQALNA